MIYIDSLNIINLSIKHKILKENNHGNVYVYRDEGSDGVNKAGWNLIDKDSLAKELMDDKNGQKALITALKNKGIDI